MISEGQKFSRGLLRPKATGDYSRTLSRVETADQIVTLLKDGMLGSWLTSSRIEMELAARTPIEIFVSLSMLIASFTIFLMFLGVMLLSTTCCSVARAFWTFSSFSRRFFSRFSAAVDIEMTSPIVQLDLSLPAFLTVYRPNRPSNATEGHCPRSRRPPPRPDRLVPRDHEAGSAKSIRPHAHIRDRGPEEYYKVRKEESKHDRV